MKVELFIAKRIHTRGGKTGPAQTPPAIRIATWGVALGMAIMILAVSIVIGFKREISEKVIGFGSHIQITGAPFENAYETSPIAPLSCHRLDTGCPTVDRQLCLVCHKTRYTENRLRFSGHLLKRHYTRLSDRFY